MYRRFAVYSLMLLSILLLLTAEYKTISLPRGHGGKTAVHANVFYSLLKWFVNVVE
jgi:hypothetical protein